MSSKILLFDVGIFLDGLRELNSRTKTEFQDKETELGETFRVRGWQDCLDEVLKLYKFCLDRAPNEKLIDDNEDGEDDG